MQGWIVPRSGSASNWLDYRHSSTTGSCAALCRARRPGPPALRASAVPIPGARWPTCAPKLIAHTLLAVPITGTRRTYSASSGTGINSCACPHQFTKRAPRGRAASRSGAGFRNGTGERILSTTARSRAWMCLDAPTIFVAPNRRHHRRRRRLQTQFAKHRLG